ncbi:MAG: heme-copper oxidase subunit III [Acidimicrobiia bacterium]
MTTTVPALRDLDGPALGKTEDEGGLSMPLMGTVLFIASEIMFFSTLLGSYYVLRSVNNPWPPEGLPTLDVVLPIILTLMLLTSSVTAHGAIWGIRNDNRTVFVTSLALTMLLGAMFLVGEIFDAVNLDFDFGSHGAYGSIFFTILGFHALHVLGGVIFFSYQTFAGMVGGFSSRNYQAVECGVWYWHFVDVVWIFVFFTLYVVR